MYNESIEECTFKLIKQVWKNIFSLWPEIYANLVKKSCLKLKTLQNPLPGLNTYQNTVHDLGKHTTSDLKLGSEALVKHNLVDAIWYSSMRNFTDTFLFVRTGPGLIVRKLLRGNMILYVSTLPHRVKVNLFHPGVLVSDSFIWVR